MTETETSEEAAESQKETNMDVILQMSSDEEVKSRNNLTQGSTLISNIIVLSGGHKTCENNFFPILQEVYGRVLRIRNLPMPDEYTDADFLSIAEPYGKVKRHWMFRLHRTVSEYNCHMYFEHIQWFHQ